MLSWSRWLNKDITFQSMLELLLIILWLLHWRLLIILWLLDRWLLAVRWRRLTIINLLLDRWLLAVRWRRLTIHGRLLHRCLLHIRWCRLTIRRLMLCRWLLTVLIVSTYSSPPISCLLHGNNQRTRSGSGSSSDRRSHNILLWHRCFF